MFSDENEDINVDDSNDEYVTTKRKSRKRKLEKSDSDIIAPSKVKGRPIKQFKVTAPSITSTDSNHSAGSRSKRNSSKVNGHDGSGLHSEEEIYSYDEALIKSSKRNRSGAKCNCLCGF